MLNYIQGLAIFRQKQIFRSNRHKNLRKQSNENFFIQLLNAWLHFTNNNFPTPTSIEEIFNKAIYFQTHTPNWTLFLLHPAKEYSKHIYHN